MIILKFLPLLFLFQTCHGVPVSSSNPKDSGDLPMIQLPYGTWKASEYDQDKDIYIFRNIRYAQPPIGNLRFRPPVEPTGDKYQIHNGSYGFSCLPTESSFTLLTERSDEDCLFLDVYVPSSAIYSKNVKLPVIVWVFGGAYIDGSKNHMIDGTVLVSESNHRIIFVAINYRLGALGFLAPDISEDDFTLNIGIHDQIAAFKWVNKYIKMFGGDPDNVNAWGHSAGAGSIMHIMTSNRDTKSPIFKRVVLLSPGFTPIVDIDGDRKFIYQTFIQQAGCAGKGVECLRGVNAKDIQKAQSIIMEQLAIRFSAFGPVVDGNFIQNLPVVSFDNGHYDKNVKSIVISHVLKEGDMFVPRNVTVQSAIASLQSTFSNDSFIIGAILDRYPPPGHSMCRHNSTNDWYSDIVSDAIFLCNARFAFDTLPKNSYAVSFAIPPSFHGSDRLSLFTTYESLRKYNHDSDFSQVADNLIAYRRYLLSYAETGDPNADKLFTNVIKWPLAACSRTSCNDPYAIQITPSDFRIISDPMIGHSKCEFWRKIFTRYNEIYKRKPSL